MKTEKAQNHGFCAFDLGRMILFFIWQSEEAQLREVSMMARTV